MSIANSQSDAARERAFMMYKENWFLYVNSMWPDLINAEYITNEGWQKDGIDVVVEMPDGRITVDAKIQPKYNESFFLETHHTFERKNIKEGWLYLENACEYIMYFLKNNVYFIPFKRLQDEICRKDSRSSGFLKNLETGYSQNDGYKSYGKICRDWQLSLIVPGIVKMTLDGKIVSTSRDISDVEKQRAKEIIARFKTKHQERKL